MSDTNPISGAAQAEDILFERRGRLALITLNRPDKMNALTHNMILSLDAQLRTWAGDDSVEAVAIRAAEGKAFCAGGDIRTLYEQGLEDGSKNFQFYSDEYRLNHRIKNYPKPYIALLDGVVMGGGVGISIHGRYRVAGDNVSFAMPECGIGLFPDVGATFFLPRLPNHFGLHMSLTGQRLDPTEAIYAHVMDYLTPSNRIELIVDQLAAADYEDAPDEVICEILAMNAIAPQPPKMREHGEEISEAYSKETLEEILSALDGGTPWAQQQAAIIRSKSPISLRYAFRAYQLGAELAFDACMRLEYRLARACMTGHDFYEGVRAVIIDKDNAPKWSPARLADVTDAAVAAAIEPLGAEELRLD
ncbi:MAG: enoyl-CoA hydratase/isomerase family protein [Rhodobacteraceae bacterium]|nr:enoyl-CoA hydratase/isomerase family protein [Paracoccaceae bacterium]